jgi:hypothetical protein
MACLVREGGARRRRAGVGQKRFCFLPFQCTPVQSTQHAKVPYFGISVSEPLYTAKKTISHSKILTKTLLKPLGSIYYPDPSIPDLALNKTNGIVGCCLISPIHSPRVSK